MKYNMELNDYVCNREECRGRIFKITKSDTPEHDLKITCVTCGDIYYYGKND